MADFGSYRTRTHVVGIGYVKRVDWKRVGGQNLWHAVGVVLSRSISILPFPPAKVECRDPLGTACVFEPSLI